MRAARGGASRTGEQALGSRGVQEGIPRGLNAGGCMGVEASLRKLPGKRRAASQEMGEEEGEGSQCGNKWKKEARISILGAEGGGDGSGR